MEHYMTIRDIGEAFFLYAVYVQNKGKRQNTIQFLKAEGKTTRNFWGEDVWTIVVGGGDREFPFSSPLSI